MFFVVLRHETIFFLTMKQISLLVIAILFCSSPIFAQEEYMYQSSADSLRRYENKRYHNALTITPLTFPAGKLPKNVILFIGDGMGLAQVFAAQTANLGALNITNLPVSGFSMTQSANDYITDSAAGGTALACGKKTNNGAIGIDEHGNALKSLVHLSENKGLSTGIVCTCALTHATPASFVTHQKSRKMYEPIAEDFLDTDIDVFIGGGSNYFMKRKDGKNLVDSLKTRKYDVVYNIHDIQTSRADKLVGLLDTVHLPRAEHRNDMLSKSVTKAIKILKYNKTGFFMMVEGSQIDWGGHANDTHYIVNETLDMDKAVGEALEFAMRDGNTLIIVTADHETGGMALMKGDSATGKIEAAYTRDDHTGSPVPVFAYGPGAELFTGMYQNTEIFNKIVNLLQLKSK